MKIRPHENLPPDSAAAADQNVTFKLHGSHSRAGFQMEELVHNTSSHSDRALESEETIQLHRFPNYCPDFKCWREAAQSKGGRGAPSAPERGHSRDATLVSSAEPGGACRLDGPAGGVYCSKTPPGRLGPQAVSSDSFTGDRTTRAKKDVSSLFIYLVL